MIFLYNLATLVRASFLTVHYIEIYIILPNLLQKKHTPFYLSFWLLKHP